MSCNLILNIVGIAFLLLFIFLFINTSTGERNPRIISLVLLVGLLVIYFIKLYPELHYEKITGRLYLIFIFLIYPLLYVYLSSVIKKNGFTRGIIIPVSIILISVATIILSSSFPSSSIVFNFSSDANISTNMTEFVLIIAAYYLQTLFILILIRKKLFLTVNETTSLFVKNLPKSVFLLIILYEAAYLTGYFLNINLETFDLAATDAGILLIGTCELLREQTIEYL